jgi:carbamoyltransferase
MTDMVILGLNAYHGDAAAALVIDGELVGAVEEERLNRVKHSAGFPEKAIRWCLADAGVAGDQVDHVAVSRDPRANLAPKIRQVFRTRNMRFVLDRARNATQIGGGALRERIARALGVGPERLRIHNVEHHRAHVASAFFVSPFEEAAVLSVDGFGDFASTMIAQGRGNSFDVLERVLYPHSLGILYTAVTQWLGFPKYGDEGKVMGLAPYGGRSQADNVRQLITLTEDGFRLNLDFFRHHREGVEMTWSDGTPSTAALFSPRLEELLGPARKPGAPLERHHEDVAAGLQMTLEEGYLHLLNLLWEKTRCPNLCLAGGVALNAVANGLIRSRTPFRELYIQPAAGDSGTAVGAAYYVYNRQLEQPRGFVMKHAYTGPSYDDDSISAALTAAGLEGQRLDEEALVRHAAAHIAKGRVVGWFQGRVEFGPRALGNRSIVADPRRAEMKDILNARIKHREPFRPFAPSVLAEETSDWFEDDYPSPFMILVYKTRHDKRHLLGAVNHVDDTGRLQTVTADVNPRYYKLINAVRELTGVPVVLNTSFNENEPIVCTPEEAIACFVETDMDVLVVGDRIVHRL